MTVNPTDKFLVNRSGSSYHVDQQDLMAQLEDDDLLLVNRNSKSYKITGAEFKDSLSSPPIIQSVTLTEDDPAGARFTSQDFTTTAVMLDNGNPASTKSIRGWVEGKLWVTPTTGPIATTGTTTGPIYSNNVTSSSVNFLRPLSYAFDGDKDTNAATSDTGLGTWIQANFDNPLGGKGDTVVVGCAEPSSNGENVWEITSNALSIPVYTSGADGVLGRDATFTAEGPVDWIRVTVFSDSGTNTTRGHMAFVEVNSTVIKDSETVTTLTLDPSADLTGFFPGENITEVGNGDDGKGTISSISGQVITLTKSEPDWNNGSDIAGEPELGDVAKQYLNLDASLNVIGLTDDDSYTRNPGNTVTPKISFPATLDNGEAPDAALPSGTSIQTEFKAENTAGSDEMVSNVVTPSPSCVSGPIETDTITAVDVTVGPTYSAFGSGSVQKGSWENLFSSGTPAEGTANGVEVVPNSTLTWDYPEDLIGSTFKVLYVLQSTEGCTLTINDGGPFTPAKSGNDGNWKVLDITDKVPSGKLTRISWTRGSVSTGGAWAIGAIYVDDIKLVDGESLTSLTFASDKDLAKLQPGDYIEQENARASITPDYVINEYRSTTNGIQKTFNESGVDNDYSRFLGVDQIYWADLGASKSIESIRFKVEGILDTATETQLKNFILYYSNSPTSIGESICGRGCNIINQLNYEREANGDVEVDFDAISNFSARYIGLSNGSSGATAFNRMVYKDVRLNLSPDPTPKPSGIVGSVNVAGNSLTLASSNGTWGPANDNHYAIGPDYICPPITLDADDPDDVETFYAIKAALVQYESERIEFQQLMVDALVAAGFTTDQIAAYIDEE